MKNEIRSHLLNTLTICLIGAGIILRIAGLDFISGDFQVFLSKWYAHLQEFGFSAFKDNFYNYAPLYLYLLLVPAKLSMPSLLGVKLISIFFDMVLALIAYKILLPEGKRRAQLVAASIWSSPTVILNSSFWGQCDSVYVAFLILAVWLVANNFKLASFLCYSIAFALKLQTIFLLPLYLILLIRDYLSLRDCIKMLFMIIFVYLLCMVPALLAGGDFFELLFKYAGQASSRSDGIGGKIALFLYGPLGWGYETYSSTARKLLYWFSLFSALTFIATMALISLRKRPLLDLYIIIVFAALFAVAVPFFLPKMFGRYFYAADILSIILVAFHIRLIWIAILVNLSSFGSYMEYLFSIQFISMRLASFMILIALSGLVSELWRTINSRQFNFIENRRISQ